MHHTDEGTESNGLGFRMRFEQMHQSNFLDGKDSSIARLRQWLNECLNNHEECSISSGA
jgi:hypothetical protein